MRKGDLETAFRLESLLPSTNMNLFDQKGVIQKFASAEEIAEAFFPIRLEMYKKRKQNMEKLAEFEAVLLESKAKFIEFVADGRIDLVQRRLAKTELVQILMDQGFMKQSELNVIKQKQVVGTNEVSVNETAASVINPETEFSYLLNMPIFSLTSERVAELQKEAKKKKMFWK